MGGEGEVGGLLEGHVGVLEEESDGVVGALLEFEGDACAHVVEFGLGVDGGEDDDVVDGMIGARGACGVAGGDGIGGAERTRGYGVEAVDVSEGGPAESEEVCGIGAGEEESEGGEAREAVELLCPEGEWVIDEELDEGDAGVGRGGFGGDVVDIGEEVEPERGVWGLDGVGVDGMACVSQGVGELGGHG